MRPPSTTWRSARRATPPMPPRSRCSVRLRNKETEEIKEQEIFMGDFPLMTTVRHLRHQRRRARRRLPDRPLPRRVLRQGDGPQDRPATYSPPPSSPTAARGWSMRPTPASVFWVRIDKNRKLPITCLIRAIGGRREYATQPKDPRPLRRRSDRIMATLEKDACKTYEEAMLEIYRKLRPGRAAHGRGQPRA